MNENVIKRSVSKELTGEECVLYTMYGIIIIVLNPFYFIGWELREDTAVAKDG